MTDENPFAFFACVRLLRSRWFVLNRRPDGVNTLSFYLSEENMVEKATYDLKDAVIEVWPHENMMKDFGFVLRLASKKAQGESLTEKPL